MLPGFMTDLYRHPARMRTGITACCLLLLTLFSAATFAQTPPSRLGQARTLVENGDLEKAIPLYKGIYDEAPFDKNVYTEYLQVLLKAKFYKDAEALVEYMQKIRREDNTLLIDLGRVQELAGNRKQAELNYNKAVESAGQDEYSGQMLAAAFTAIQKEDYAIKVYEQLQKESGNPFQYATELAGLYGAKGDVKNALSALMHVAEIQPQAMTDIKASLLKLTETDPAQKEAVQKEIAKRLKKDPDNVVWNDLQNWLFMQYGEYDKVLEQVIALDKRSNNQGARVYIYAGMAAKEGRYSQAVQGYEYVLAFGPSSPLYQKALIESVLLQTQQLQERLPVDQQLLEATLQQYNRLFREFPEYKSQPIRKDYAMLLARYAHRVDSAIHVLNELVEIPGLPKSLIAASKLDLGDYYILEEKIWDASLMYSQVDKMFKQDMLGEEARFRNARLAYYRGDFQWAQTQLSVLKSSTTELIANDALYLSVLITENTPPDSNITPLLKFAHADLLLFQNKTKDADALLDSIAKAFPENPLQDDMLMLGAKIATQEGRLQDAVSKLETVLTHYGDDVLGDDAAFQLAVIYEKYLQNAIKAMEYYEKLITLYPGSTYVQQARAVYRRLAEQQKPS